MLWSLIAVLVVSASAFEMPTFANGKGVNWAVLVAGSNTWPNYRHQADICHSYQVLKEHGLPDERIIVMMYDDIADNPSNPNKGVIINQPNGPNVYAGVPKDYTKGEVTPENFMKVLKGDVAGLRGVGSGKVLNSTADDNVFINFSDHGGPGLIAFPTTTMSAKQLNETLAYMFEHRMYANLLFYLEACESGSMFAKILPNNINIFATTAANPTTSSYACYYDSTLGTYLGDVYSVNWMQNSDTANLSKETILQQYKIVKKATNTSTVCQYGQQSITAFFVEDFFGNVTVNTTQTTAPQPGLDAVDARTVRMAILQHRFADASTSEEKDMIQMEIDELLELERTVYDTYVRIVTNVIGSGNNVDELFARHDEPVAFECLHDVMNAFNDHCFVFGQNDFALKYAFVLSNMCNDNESWQHIVDAIITTCDE